MLNAADWSHSRQLLEYVGWVSRAAVGRQIDWITPSILDQFNHWIVHSIALNGLILMIFFLLKLCDLVHESISLMQENAVRFSRLGARQEPARRGRPRSGYVTDDLWNKSIFIYSVKYTTKATCLLILDHEYSGSTALLSTSIGYILVV